MFTGGSDDQNRVALVFLSSMKDYKILQLNYKSGPGLIIAYLYDVVMSLNLVWGYCPHSCQRMGTSALTAHKVPPPMLVLATASCES